MRSGAGREDAQGGEPREGGREVTAGVAWATLRAGTDGGGGGRGQEMGTSRLLLKHVGGIAALQEASPCWVRTLFSRS